MIYLFNESNSKFKQTKYYTSEELIKGLNNTPKYTHEDQAHWKGFFIENQEGLDKKINKGDNVYCWIEPFVPGYSDGDIIYWFSSPEEAERCYNQWQDDI